MMTRPTPASDALTSSVPQCTSTFTWPTTREYILYFIRHGEAMHNILEKAAESSVRQSLLQQGYDANSSYVTKAIDDARKAILDSESMEDPPLSELGVQEAERAKRELEQLICTLELPAVQEVWVSPLQRALKTASIIFPHTSSNNVTKECSEECTEKSKPRIKVIKELEERRTGLACDTYSPWKSIRRPSFQHFSLSGLRLDSMENLLGINSSNSLDKMDCLREENATSEEGEVGGGLNDDFGFLRLSGHPNEEVWEQLEDCEIGENLTRVQKPRSSDGSNLSSKRCKDVRRKEVKKEDKDMLRERTKKLFHLLEETDSTSICLVGHKGYLRELERGPLGHSDAELFKNCEVRVYRLILDFANDDALDPAEKSADANGIHMRHSVLAERLSR